MVRQRCRNRPNTSRFNWGKQLVTLTHGAGVKYQCKQRNHCRDCLTSWLGSTIWRCHPLLHPSRRPSAIFDGKTTESKLRLADYFQPLPANRVTGPEPTPSACMRSHTLVLRRWPETLFQCAASAMAILRSEVATVVRSSTFTKAPKSEFSGSPSSEPSRRAIAVDEATPGVYHHAATSTVRFAGPTPPAAIR